MDPPTLTRYRRPFFLAPLWLTFLGALLVLAVAFSLYRSAGTTVVLLVRAAEKDAATIADPPISPEGEERAQRLAHLLGEDGSGIDAIYVSDERRSQQTAAPLAERLHRAPVVFASADAGAAADRLLHEQRGGTVLVIAGSAGFLALLRTLGDREVTTPAQEEAGVMYLLSIPTFGRTHLVRLKL
jgi:broad specificity phosphatase PhoE